jgi:MYXO-CTERM domain-containing protein
VRCAGINTAQNVATESRLLWRQYIAEREDRTYRTEVRVASVLDAQGKATNKAYLVYQESMRTRERGKGSQQLLATVVEATPQGLNMMGVPQTGVFPASDATHGSACATNWGTEGQEVSRAFLISASHNGSTGALASAQLVDWDGTARTLKPDRKLSLNAAIDHTWLSNIYGNNPNMQGRNFITCVGNIKNPGFGVQGGYMSDVKSFVGVPATTRRMNEATGRPEEKLATELVLVPAVIRAAQAEPQPLPPPNPTSPGVPPTPNGSGTVPPVNNEGPTGTGTPAGPESTPSASEQPASGSSSEPPASGGDVLTTDGDTTSTGATPPGSSLGCSQAQGPSNASPLALLALLGLVGLVRRRK